MYLQIAAWLLLLAGKSGKRENDCLQDIKFIYSWNSSKSRLLSKAWLCLAVMDGSINLTTRNMQRGNVMFVLVKLTKL